jgi:hypothetical protein
MSLVRDACATDSERAPSVHAMRERAFLCCGRLGARLLLRGREEHGEARVAQEADVLEPLQPGFGMTSCLGWMVCVSFIGHALIHRSCTHTGLARNRCVPCAVVCMNCSLLPVAKCAGADVAGASRVPAQMWEGVGQSWRRCGRGEPSPGADVGGDAVASRQLNATRP